jgi:hypothetical protein
MTKKVHPEIELHPNAWERFERAAGVVVKTPPQHRVKPKAKPKPSARPERGKRKQHGD